eukprot:Gb_08038 [translate_table: standard]
MSSNSTLTDLSKVGLGYGIAIALGILVLITTIMLASYVCVRVHGQSQIGHGGRSDIHGTVGQRRGAHSYESSSSAVAVSIAGLDQATLDSYPKVVYSEKQCNPSKPHADNSCCSICLSDYKESEVLRLLPDCGHMFHVACIDAWLRLHATCPMCRTSPLPSPQTTPLSTPLSEFVPLARHYIGRQR